MTCGPIGELFGRIEDMMMGGRCEPEGKWPTRRMPRSRGLRCLAHKCSEKLVYGLSDVVVVACFRLELMMWLELEQQRRRHVTSQPKHLHHRHYRLLSHT